MSEPFVTYEPGVPLPEKVCERCGGTGYPVHGFYDDGGIWIEGSPCPDCHGTGKAQLRVLVEQPDGEEAFLDLLDDTNERLDDDWFVLINDFLPVKKGYTQDDLQGNIYHGLRIRTQADVAHIADLVRLPGGRWLLVEPEEWLGLTGHLEGIGWVVVRVKPCAACAGRQAFVQDECEECEGWGLSVAGYDWAENIVNDCQRLGVPVYCQELGVFEEGI